MGKKKSIARYNRLCAMLTIARNGEGSGFPAGQNCRLCDDNFFYGDLGVERLEGCSVRTLEFWTERYVSHYKEHHPFEWAVLKEAEKLTM